MFGAASLVNHIWHHLAADNRTTHSIHVHTEEDIKTLGTWLSLHSYALTNLRLGISAHLTKSLQKICSTFAPHLGNLQHFQLHVQNSLYKPGDFAALGESFRLAPRLHSLVLCSSRVSGVPRSPLDDEALVKLSSALPELQALTLHSIDLNPAGKACPALSRPRTAKFYSIGNAPGHPDWETISRTSQIAFTWPSSYMVSC